MADIKVDGIDRFIVAFCGSGTGHLTQACTPVPSASARAVRRHFLPHARILAFQHGALPKEAALYSIHMRLRAPPASLPQAMQVVELLQQHGKTLAGVITDDDASKRMLDEMVTPLGVEVLTLPVHSRHAYVCIASHLQQAASRRCRPPM